MVWSVALHKTSLDQLIFLGNTVKLKGNKNNLHMEGFLAGWCLQLSVL